MSLPVIIQPASPINLIVGVQWNGIRVEATGGIAGGYYFTNRPPGISLTRLAGFDFILSGTPTQAGVFTSTISGFNGSGTGDPITIVFNVAATPAGPGATTSTDLSPWSDFVLTIDHGTRQVTAPGVAPMESGAIFSIARGDVIDLLVGLEKYGVLADLGATVTVEVAPKEFEAEAVLNLTSAVATRVQTSSLADTTRYRVRLTMTAANYALLADYATETEAAMIAPVQIRMIAGSKLICSDTFLVEILRDAVPD